jgi:pimeloyl-ACP methyl ester carboxylesterase
MSKKDVEREVAALHRPGAATAAINYYRNLFDLPKYFTNAKLFTPTLLLWGEQDSALGKEPTVDMEKYVDNIRVQYLPHASHW